MSEQVATSGVPSTMDDQQSNTNTEVVSNDMEYRYPRDVVTESDDSNSGNNDDDQHTEEQELGQDEDVNSESSSADGDEDDANKGEDVVDPLQERLDKLEESNKRLLELLEKQVGDKKSSTEPDKPVAQIFAEAPEDKIPDMLKSVLPDRYQELTLDALDIKLVATLIEQRTQSLEKVLAPILNQYSTYSSGLEDQNKLIMETDGDIYNYIGKIEQKLWQKYKGKTPENMNKTQEMRQMYQAMKQEEKQKRAQQFAKAKNAQAHRITAAPPKNTTTNKGPAPKKSYLESLIDDMSGSR